MFLWGHLKSLVYNDGPRDLDALKANIITECRKVTAGNVAKRAKGMRTERIGYWIFAEGRQFEHIL
jgi:hypothetical protein